MSVLGLFMLGRDYFDRQVSALSGGHEHQRSDKRLLLSKAGESLAEHESSGEATLQVLEGRVLLRFGDLSWNGSPGDLLIIRTGSTRDAIRTQSSS